MNNFITINCPKCGYEYLPAEIFIPKAFIGTPKDIIRDSNHKIEDFMGKSLDIVEEYTCDHCHTTFSVDTDIKFITTISKNDFGNTEYAQKLKKPKKIVMSEE